MKKYLFSLILICNQLFGQPDLSQSPFIPALPFQSEIISLPGTDSTYVIYFTYKIPYRLLVFERKDESFSAGVRVTVEILDKDSRMVERNIKDTKITVNNFEETNDLSLYLQDFLTFKLDKGEYRINTFISDKNSTDEIPLEPAEVILSGNKIVQHPLVIQSQDFICDGQKSFVLANTGGKVPFSGEQFHLIIPLTDTTITELNVKIENNGEVIISKKVSESYVIPIGVNECEKHLTITKSSKIVPLRNFVLRNVNEKLNEGELTLTITNNENSIEEKYKSKIVWFNKPFSLMDPERAIELLSYIESDSVIYPLLKNSSSEYHKILSEYWKKFDPTPETTFNEIMFEYYSRIDYASREFRSIGKDKKSKSDRGTVYIKFGKPDKIERTSNEQGQVIEIWFYANPQRKFSFIDKRGTGNFTLTEN